MAKKKLPQLDEQIANASGSTTGAIYREYKQQKGNKDNSHMPFGMINYIGMFVSILLIFVGFWVMAIDHTFIDATEFSLALNVSPIIIMMGYALLVVAIMLRPGKKEATQQ